MTERRSGKVKRELNYWLAQLAYNMALYHNKKAKKWCKKYEECLKRWTAEYSGGNVQ